MEVRCWLVHLIGHSIFITPLHSFWSLSFIHFWLAENVVFGCCVAGRWLKLTNKLVETALNIPYCSHMWSTVNCSSTWRPSQSVFSMHDLCYFRPVWMAFRRMNLKAKNKFICWLAIDVIGSKTIRRARTQWILLGRELQIQMMDYNSIGINLFIVL